MSLQNGGPEVEGGRGVSASEHRVSLWYDENILKWIVVMDVQL